MPTEPNQNEAAALALSAEQREQSAQRSLQGIKEQEDDVDLAAVERAWIEEADRRYQRYLAGETKGFPAEEVLARVRSRLRRV
jgi:hypothetical protein